MDDPGGWGPRLLRMFDAIERWRSRIEQEPLRPAPGSSLANDDAVFPPLPASSVAYNGLLTAVEHLDFFRAALTATRTLYPAAYYTVLRSALMGSAQAVWVLVPPDPATRAEHSLRIAVDSYKQERNRINELTNLTDDQQVIVDQSLAKIDARLSEAATAADALGLRGSTVGKWRLNMTTVIKDAIDLAFLDGTEESATVRDSIGMLWRSQSGHAHGVPHSRLSRVRTTDVVHGADGRAYSRSTTEIADIGVAATAPTLLTSEGLRHYDRDCGI